MVVVSVAVMVSQATAHIERASYWPNPKPDKSVSPPAGGKVPKARRLYTRSEREARGHHARRLPGQLDPPAAQGHRKGAHPRATSSGRPSARVHISADAGQQAARVQPPAAREVQVRLDPGRGHTSRATTTASWSCPASTREPKSRAAPTHDPQVRGPQAGQRQAGRHRRQPERRGVLRLPGQVPQRPEPDRGDRAAPTATGTDPQPPRDDRHGIPNIGPCIRCNLQIEGSGVGPDDVVDRRRPRGVGQRGPDRRRRRTWASAATAPTASCCATSTSGTSRARHLRARVRRLPARALQDLLRRRVRRAHLRRGPRR